MLCYAESYVFHVVDLNVIQNVIYPCVLYEAQQKQNWIKFTHQWEMVGEDFYPTMFPTAAQCHFLWLTCEARAVQITQDFKQKAHQILQIS